MRYRLSETWGLGFRLKPTINDDATDYETTTTTDSSTTLDTRRAYTTLDRRLALSAMLFREVRISRYVSVGPYLGLGYERRFDKQTTEPWTDNGSTYYNWDRTTTDIVFLEAGIRPAFEFFERFVLETRLGFVLSHSDMLDERYSRNGANTSSNSRSSSSWDFYFSGRDLGPGAVMQFMIIF